MWDKLRNNLSEYKPQLDPENVMELNLLGDVQ